MVSWWIVGFFFVALCNIGAFLLDIMLRHSTSPECNTTHVKIKGSVPMAAIHYSAQF